jgi:hypothetical protein
MTRADLLEEADMKRAFIIACACLTWADPARADVVVDWNQFAAQAVAQAVSVGARPGPTSAFDFAMVHLAMHDAIQAFEGRFQPYCEAIPNAAGSPIAAAATAAHAVLVSLFPTQTESLNSLYDSYLDGLGLTGDAGAFVGQHAAVCILNRRMGDGRFPTDAEPFYGGAGLGEWRPTSFLPGTPPVPVPMVTPWVATVTPFTLKDPAQFRASPPPLLTSGRYARDYNEVKRMGSLTGSARSVEQTDVAYFFSDNSILLWTRALRNVAGAYLSDIGDSARLFALSYIAIADAYITSWDSKRHWNFWRPITAIHEGDNDGNPRTAGDAAWQSLITTPSYPDYTSGANNNSGAVTTMLASFFGTDKVTFSMTSNTPQVIQKTRTYERLSDAAQDVVDARVYLGIHFRFADVVARRQGSHVARWAFHHFLRPVGKDKDCDAGDSTAAPIEPSSDHGGCVAKPGKSPS